jgi:hypothetical protein
LAVPLLISRHGGIVEDIGPSVDQKVGSNPAIDARFVVCGLSRVDTGWHLAVLSRPCA